MVKRITCLLLVVLLLAGIMPAAYATEPPDAEEVTATTETTQPTAESPRPTESEPVESSTPSAPPEESSPSETEAAEESEVREEPATSETEPLQETTAPVSEPTEEPTSTDSTEPTEAEPEVFRANPLNLHEPGISTFARYTLTKWLDHMIMPHKTIYIDWTFPDGSEPFVNGSTGYGDATFQYPSYLEINGAPAYLAGLISIRTGAYSSPFPQSALSYTHQRNSGVYVSFELPSIASMRYVTSPFLRAS